MTTGTVEDTCIFVIEKNSEQRLSILLTVLTIKIYDLKKQIILQSATHGILHIGKMSSYQFHVNELCHLICLGFLKERGDGYIIMIFGKNINFNLIDSVELNVPRTVLTFC